ncbi:MAG: hypothetical protein ABIQ73_01360 [Acidimicrobiales bacterium]
MALAQIDDLFYRWRRDGWALDEHIGLEVMTDMWVAAFAGAPRRTAKRGS